MYMFLTHMVSSYEQIPGKNIFPRQTTPFKTKFEFSPKTVDYPWKITSFKLLQLLVLVPTRAFFF